MPIPSLPQAALDLIRRNEGLRLEAYEDIAGVWTIGYGHTPAEPGEVITEVEATQLLLGDLEWAERAVDDATCDVATSKNQFGALVSLTFNIGPQAFRRSTVLRLHRQGDFQGAAQAFLLWDKYHHNGELEVSEGLLRRRQEEAELYLLDDDVPLTAQA